MAIDTMKKAPLKCSCCFCSARRRIRLPAGAADQGAERGRFIGAGGLLLPLLYRLADDGFITGKETFVKMKTGRSRMRIMYHLEPAGRERLRVLREEYEAVHRGIQNILNSGEVDA